MNIKYLTYNLIKTNYTLFFTYTKKCSETYNRSKASVIIDAFKCLYKYNTFFLDYFYLGYFKKTKPDKSEHTNVWDMYLFQKKFNDKKQALVIRDKISFRKKYHEFFNYKYFILKSHNQNDFSKWLLQNKLNKIVCKNPQSAAGKRVIVLKVEYDNQSVFIAGKPLKLAAQDLFNDQLTLIEEFIQQHTVLNNISPSSVNTVRIVTFINDKREVEIWATLLRISVQKNVDNFDAGGISAPIDIKSGRITKPAVIKDPFVDETYEYHPVTRSAIKDIVIPFWPQIIEMINSAALVLPEIRTVGWDVAVTVTGPTLIEGNDNWDKTHFELTSGIRLKKRIRNLINQ